MYDISGFFDWLNDIPDNLGEDDSGPTFEERGLKPGAPQSAIDAYQKFLKDMKQARKNGVKF